MMELELKKMYDTVASIHDEMFYLRERYRINETSSTSELFFLYFSLLFLFLFFLLDSDLQFDCSFGFTMSTRFDNYYRFFFYVKDLSSLIKHLTLEG